jgi:hypothetical protein
MRKKKTKELIKGYYLLKSKYNWRRPPWYIITYSATSQWQEPSYISPGGDTVITKRKNEAYIKKHRINRNSVANTKGKY